MSKQQKLSEHKVKSIFVDETPFVFLTRDDGDFELKPELARFIDQCKKNNGHKSYRVYSSKIVKRKLGYGFLYNTFRELFTRNLRKKEQFQKRLARRRVARKVTTRFYTCKKYTLTPNWSLMDIHLFANENKRNTLSRPLQPTEVISMDVCQNAFIAHTHSLPIFSFNEDYQYFITMPGVKGTYIQYWKPSDVLNNLSV